MKKIWNIVLYVIAVAAAGFAIGAYLGHLNQLWYLIPGVIAGVCLFEALVLTTSLRNAAIEAADANVSLKRKDIILKVGETYQVSKHGKLQPGEYKVLATDESNKTFNLRVNDYVNEYKHNTTLILAEGDTISPRSDSVILR